MKGGAFIALAALAAGAAAMLSSKPSSAEPGASGGASPGPGGGGSPAPSSGASGARLLRLISPNMSGPDVLQWQTQLATLGYSPGKIDGVFGPLSETKTREFQTAADLEVDGIVGPATRAAAARMLLAGGGGGGASSPEPEAPDFEPEPTPDTYATEEPDYGPPPPVTPSGVVSTPPFVPPMPPFVTPAVVPGPTTPPDALLAEVAAALASNDPIVIKAMIAKVATLGWPMLANDLQAALRALETGQPVPLPSTSIFSQTKPPVLYPTSSAGTKPPANPVVLPTTTTQRVLLLTSPNMKGVDVLFVQNRLVAHGYSPGKLDQVYGPGTETAVRTFQKAKGLTVDGKVGPVTLAALKAAPSAKPAAKPPAVAVKPAAAAPAGRILMLTSPNMRGTDVQQVQQRLNALGYNVGNADGVFGPKTETGVRTFQKAKGLLVDGKVGPQTRAALGGITAISGDEMGAIGAPPFPLPASPLPGVIPFVTPTLQQAPFQTLATHLVQHLLTHPERGSEDQALVQAYQRQVRGLQPTGMYGPGTALSLISCNTGHVPPKPRYWPKDGTAGAKARYSAQVLAQAQKDPQRAEEWRQASEIP